MGPRGHHVAGELVRKPVDFRDPERDEGSVGGAANNQKDGTEGSRSATVDLPLLWGKKASREDRASISECPHYVTTPIAV